MNNNLRYSDLVYILFLFSTEEKDNPEFADYFDVYGEIVSLAVMSKLGWCEITSEGYEQIHKAYLALEESGYDLGN